MSPAFGIARLALAALSAPAAQAAMEVSSALPLDGVGVARGVVLIRCSTDQPNVSHLSRGAVLDLGSAATDRDVVLTTAHGLPDSRDAAVRDCTISGERGRLYRVERVWHARSERGVSSDWAVLLVKRRLEGDVGRLAVGQLGSDRLAELARDRAPIRLLLRHANPAEGDCRLRVAGPAYEASPTDLMMYQCRLGLSAPGLSGSPLLVGTDGRSLLVGIHLGWSLEILDDGRFHPVSIGRPVDDAIAVAIESAAAAAKQHVGKRSRIR
jgi:hypothetical protein